QPVGSQLLIDADGNFLGSVSGGCVEAEVITKAADVIASGESKSLELRVGANPAWKVGLACGGSIRIFVEKVERSRSSSDGLLHRLVDDVEARRQVALVTDLATSAQELAGRPYDLGKERSPGVGDAFRCDKSIALAGEIGEVFINVF